MTCYVGQLAALQGHGVYRAHRGDLRPRVINMFDVINIYKYCYYRNTNDNSIHSWVFIDGPPPPANNAPGS